MMGYVETVLLLIAYVLAAVISYFFGYNLAGVVQNVVNKTWWGDW